MTKSSKRQTWVLLFAFTLALGAHAEAKKKKNVDAVAESIAKARSTEEGTAAGTEDDIALKELLGDAKLVARSDDKIVTEAKTAATEADAVMAGSEEAEAAALEGVGGKSESIEEAAKTETAAPEAAVPAPKDIAKMNEKDIPVLTSKEKTAKAPNTGMTRVMGSLGILIVLLGAAIWGVRKLSKRSQGKNQNTKIKILTQHHLGPKKSVVILQVAGESILVGVTDQSITMLKTLSLLDEEIPEDPPRDFSAAMDGYEDEEPAPRSRSRGPEDFAMRGLGDIRDSVSKRLRGLKEL